MAPEAILTLRFTLPATFALMVPPPGRWRHEQLHKVTVDIGAQPREDRAIVIRCESTLLSEARRLIFDQAQRFLIAIAGGRDKLPTADFVAVLRSSTEPAREERFAVVTGAAVSITRAVEKPMVA